MSYGPNVLMVFGYLPPNQHSLSSKVVRCELSQKCRQWAVLIILLIDGTF